MTLLGALVVLLHLRRCNLDFLHTHTYNHNAVFITSLLDLWAAFIRAIAAVSLDTCRQTVLIGTTGTGTRPARLWLKSTGRCVC